MEDYYVKKFIKMKYNINNIESVISIGNHELGRNYVYEFEKNNIKYVVKFSISKDKWENEIKTHKILEKLFFVPVTIDVGSLDGDNYQVMYKKKGLNLSSVWDKMESIKKNEISEKLGVALALIHNVESYKYFGGWEEELSNPDIISDRIARDENIINNVKSFEKFKDNQYIIKGIDELPTLRNKLKHIDAVIAHKDFSFRNIIIDKNDISGIIDFEHSVPDDPGIDLCTIMQTSMFEDEKNMEHFKYGYNSIRNFPVNFVNNISYYQIITGLYICSKYKYRNKEDLERGISLIKKGLE